MRERPDSQRREFLGGLLAGLAGAAALRPPPAAAEVDPAKHDGTYRRTPHVDTYYRTLRD